MANATEGYLLLFAFVLHWFRSLERILWLVNVNGAAFGFDERNRAERD